MSRRGAKYKQVPERRGVVVKRATVTIQRFEELYALADEKHVPYGVVIDRLIESYLRRRKEKQRKHAPPLQEPAQEG